jgi:hypothetical protein
VSGVAQELLQRREDRGGLRGGRVVVVSGGDPRDDLGLGEAIIHRHSLT